MIVLPYIIVSCSLMILVAYMLLINKKYCKKFFNNICTKLKPNYKNKYSKKKKLFIKLKSINNKNENNYNDVYDEQRCDVVTDSDIDDSFDSTASIEDEFKKLNWNNYEYDFNETENIYDLPCNSVNDTLSSEEITVYNYHNNVIINNVCEESDDLINMKLNDNV
ncbi:126R [Yaba monkey tumor virus]|uniref:126R n=1 Tax=Yaba monkey tumor virus (strain VR587) TaxID=928314 RepID=Q6TUP3_YMTV5|nr:126R [Yaba monkey tumor virus]AAR07483.1 126R [Yaba monkey tumor virus]